MTVHLLIKSGTVTFKALEAVTVTVCLPLAGVMPSCQWHWREP